MKLLLINIGKNLLMFILGHCFGKYVVMLVNTKMHFAEKHHCNKCGFSFMHSEDAMEYTFCPFCGQSLDYHYKDERSKDYKGDK